MRIPLTSQVALGLLGSALLLTAGCGNPSALSLDSLSISATPAAVTVGGTVTLHATAHLSNGTTQDVTGSTQWTLSNSGLASMANGVLTSKAPGTLNVQGAYVEIVGSSSSAASSASQTLSSSAQVTITAASTSAGTTTTSTGTGTTSTPPPTPTPTPAPIPTPTTPLITWNTPAAIAYGTALSNVQLNASTSAAGTFAYTPAAGTIPNAGSQTLTATFTPADTTTYSTATATVLLTVSPATPVITWPAPAAIVQGAALGAAQLDATANMPGTFSYNPGAGALLGMGIQPLTVTFTPSNTANYATTTAATTLNVLPISSGDLDGSDKWEWNHDPGTPGSSTGSSLYPVTSPSLDNAARGFYVNYSDNGGEIYHLSFATDTTVSHFIYDVQIYLTDPSQIQNIEMDMNQVMSDGRTVILATQCAAGSGTFEYTTVSNGATHWHPSNIPCKPKNWTANTWHHVQIATQRDDSGNVTYDWVNLDGTTTNFVNATGPSAESLGWAMGDLLLNFQLDGAQGNGSITAYIDDLTIYRW